MAKPVFRTEIQIFGENSRSRENKIRSLIPEQCIDAVKRHLGDDAAKQVEASMKAMDKHGLDFIQMRIGNRRVRVQQELVG